MTSTWPGGWSTSGMLQMLTAALRPERCRWWFKQLVPSNPFGKPRMKLLPSAGCSSSYYSHLLLTQIMGDLSFSLARSLCISNKWNLVIIFKKEISKTVHVRLTWNISLYILIYVYADILQNVSFTKQYMQFNMKMLILKIIFLNIYMCVSENSYKSGPQGFSSNWQGGNFHR